MSAGKALNAALLGSPVNQLAGQVTSQSGVTDSFLLTDYEVRERLQKECRSLVAQITEARKGRNKILVTSLAKRIYEKQQQLATLNLKYRARKKDLGNFLGQAIRELLGEEKYRQILKRAEILADEHNKRKPT